MNEELYELYQSYSPEEIDAEFISSCMVGDFLAVKYLLTTTDLKYNADIHSKNDQGFRYACQSGSLDIVKYLLTSDELSEHVTEQIEPGFTLAVRQEHIDVIKFLIFDYVLPESETLDRFLNLNQYTDIEQMFTIRSEQYRLIQNLPEQSPLNVKRLKI